jgi:hypothetical protein
MSLQLLGIHIEQLDVVVRAGHQRTRELIKK